MISLLCRAGGPQTAPEVTGIRRSSGGPVRLFRGGRYLALCAIVVLVAACGSRVPSDDSLQSKLEPLLDSPGSTRLAEVATYEWDRVYLFLPYTPAGDVNDTVGGKVLGDWEQWVPETQDLLVFNLDGHPVRAAHIAGFVIYSDPQRPRDGWSRDVLLEPRCGQLFLHEPGQDPGPEDCSG